MRENKVYSVHNQPESKPHKVGTKSDVENAPTQAEPVAQSPTATTPQAQPAEPVIPVAKSEKIEPEPLELGPVPGQQQAIEFARSKIAHIYGYSYGKEAGQPEPGQSPVIAAGYAAEQRLQETSDPHHDHYAQPDHQLLANNPAHHQPTDDGHKKQYETFTLPGAPLEAPKPEPKPASVQKSKKSTPKKKKNTVKNLRSKIKKRTKPATHHDEPKVIHRFRRFVPVGILITVVVLIMNNQLVYGQISYYVTPGNRVETPTIVESSVDNVAPPGSRVVIPKINVDVPVNYDVDSYSEEAIQAGLENGVVHYAKTGMPGEVGNNVIFGHSTNNFWNSGKYKTAFVLLDRLDKGDTFEIHHEQKRYIYEIYEKKVIEPDDFSIVTQKVTEPIATLVTCTPPGTSWQRLVVQARQISPEPQSSDTPQGNELPEGLEGDVPSNSESPLEGLFGWLW